MFEKRGLNQKNELPKNNKNEFEISEIKSESLKKYKDSDGILHFKTILPREKTNKKEIWEIVKKERGKIMDNEIKNAAK